MTKRFGTTGMAFDGGPMPYADGQNNSEQRPAFRPNQDLSEEAQRQLGGYMAGGAVIERADGSTGTSIFDPVICELAYRWFCPTGGTVLDPFAGGSVRGIVAAVLGLQYVGIDLSARQVEANEAQAEAICEEIMPHWIVGDSKELDDLAPDIEADLIFSCPPYHDLEIYTDDPADLSTMEWDGFLATYREIIAKSVAHLKDNRFACFVVGDIRDKQGFYRNFVGETVRAFEDAGAVLYNEAILVTAVGSLPIRVGKQFSAGRKLGKTHQNVLVFYKGDPKQIKQEFPADLEFADLQEAED